MAGRAQVISTGRERATGAGTLEAIVRGAVAHGMTVRRTSTYEPSPGWMVLWGVGDPQKAEWRDAHVASGHRALLWDMGYVERGRHTGHFRASIDTDHPWQWLDQTPPDPSRWDRLGRPLREDAAADGPIILIGLGQKSRAIPAQADWEKDKVAELRERFPDRQIIHRPKPKSDVAPLGLPLDRREPIDAVIAGASLVVCRHSNVAIDACIAGVPFECEDGIAFWLRDKPFTPEVRLDFLRRMAWWQWRLDEMKEAWRFFEGLR